MSFVRSVRSGRVAVLVVAGVLLVSCSGGEGQAELDVAAEGSGDGSSPPEEEPRDSGDDEPDSSDDADAATTSGADAGASWPDPIPVDAVGRHPGGLSVEVFEIRIEATSVEVDIRATNGQDRSAVLTPIAPRTLTQLIDDVGAVYPLVPPEGDRLISLDPGEVLEGTLSFAGPLSSGATSLTLEFHPDEVDEEQDGGVERPYLTFEDLALAGGTVD